MKNLCATYFFDFIEINDIFYKNEFGFQRENITEHTVFDLYTNKLQTIESKEKASSVFLEFAKTFASPNHKIRVDKLELYGVRGLPLTLFKSYLSYRKQALKMGSASKTLKTITCGVS